MEMYIVIDSLGVLIIFVSSKTLQDIQMQAIAAKLAVEYEIATHNIMFLWPTRYGYVLAVVNEVPSPITEIDGDLVHEISKQEVDFHKDIAWLQDILTL